MSDTKQSPSTSAKKDDDSQQVTNKNNQVSTNNNKVSVNNEEMIKKAKRALLADAHRMKQGAVQASNRRPQTTMINTQFLGRLLNQPNSGRITKPRKTNVKKSKK